MGKHSFVFWLIVAGAAVWPARAIFSFGRSVWENSRRRTSAFELVARGISSIVSDMGPWTLSDLMLGLSALAKFTETEPPMAPGRRLDELAHDPCFLAEAQHWRAIAEAAYAESAVQWSLQTGLPESALLSANWSSHAVTLCPAYVVAIDAAFGAVVLAVRGTKDVVDVLVDVAAAPHHFLGRWCHGGFVHGARVLLEEVQPHLTRALKDYPSFEVVCVGHSLGAGVATMSALLLRKKISKVRCWTFAPPACVDEDLAALCKPFTISIIANHDLVPRFSAASVEQLREEICSFDWDKVVKLSEQDNSWRILADAASSMKRLQSMYYEASKKIQQLDRALDLRRTPASSRRPEKKILDEKVNTSQEEVHLESSILNLAMGLDDSLTLKGSDNAGEDSEFPSSVLSLSSDNNLLTGSSNEEDMEVKAMGNISELCSTNSARAALPLFPPGKLIVLSCIPNSSGVIPALRLTAPYIRSYGVFPSYEQARQLQWTLSEATIHDFRKIIVSPWWLSDHLLSTIGIGLDSLQRQAPPLIPKLRTNNHLSAFTPEHQTS